MICSIINEGTAPRYAPGGLQPTSKPVAPSKRRHYTPSALDQHESAESGALWRREPILVAAVVPCRAASRDPSPPPACRVAFCPWPDRQRVWRDRAAST